MPYNSNFLPRQFSHMATPKPSKCPNFIRQHEKPSRGGTTRTSKWKWKLCSLLRTLFHRIQMNCGLLENHVSTWKPAVAYIPISHWICMGPRPLFHMIDDDRTHSASLPGAVTSEEAGPTGQNDNFLVSSFVGMRAASKFQRRANAS